ncbi:MAG: alpha/beta hydrolase [Patescibacteria group bacterium]
MNVFKFSIIVLSILLIFLISTYLIGFQEMLHPKEQYDNNHNVIDNKILINGLNIYYLEQGGKELPTVIFLHGWSGTYDQTSIRQILTTFHQNGYRAISIELPGMGRSSTPSISWTNELYADFLNDFTESLQIKKMILVGQSFGGGIAVKFSLKYSDKLEKLVLVNASSNNKTKFKKNLVKFLGGIFKKVIATKTFPRNFQNQLTEYMLRLPSSALQDQSAIDRLPVMSDTFVLTHSEDMLESLANISIPTLIVWGKSDTKIPISQARKMADLIPNVKLFELSGGHRLIYDKPKETVNLIIGNLSNSDL